jgi:hypothetical protein
VTVHPGAAIRRHASKEVVSKRGPHGDIEPARNERQPHERR